MKKNTSKKKELNFVGITREQLETKLSITNSPIYCFQYYNITAHREDTWTQYIGVQNPDPVRTVYIYVHVFIGLAGIITDPKNYFTALDPRCPRLTQPNLRGLKIEPGTYETVKFLVPIPKNIESTSYMANTILFRHNSFSLSEEIDRCSAIFEVV